MRQLLPLFFLLTSQTVLAEDQFLEGFPDVPLVAGVQGIEGESVIFDTPSGTIAEVKLKIEGRANKIMENYAESLSGLGWTCVKSPHTMRCEREENRLIFTDPSPQIKNGTVILRLEPKG